mmetsp:Transcript_44557/g.113363  ORF Transcript_44557/g.113363 Transcript_44557/m.113363 type:complete len:489 (-) Transcript_44557:835-2301(-)
MVAGQSDFKLDAIRRRSGVVWLYRPAMHLEFDRAVAFEGLLPPPVFIPNLSLDGHHPGPQSLELARRRGVFNGADGEADLQALSGGDRCFSHDLRWQCAEERRHDFREAAPEGFIRQQFVETTERLEPHATKQLARHLARYELTSRLTAVNLDTAVEDVEVKELAIQMLTWQDPEAMKFVPQLTSQSGNMFGHVLTISSKADLIVDGEAQHLGQLHMLRPHATSAQVLGIGSVLVRVLLPQARDDKHQAMPVPKLRMDVDGGQWKPSIVAILDLRWRGHHCAMAKDIVWKTCMVLQPICESCSEVTDRLLGPKSFRIPRPVGMRNEINMAREEDALALRNLAQHVCASNDGPGNLAHVDALADCRIHMPLAWPPRAWHPRCLDHLHTCVEAELLEKVVIIRKSPIDGIAVQLPQVPTNIVEYNFARPSVLKRDDLKFNGVAHVPLLIDRRPIHPLRQYYRCLRRSIHLILQLKVVPKEIFDLDCPIQV